MNELTQEFQGLWRYVERVRKEIAGMYKPADDDHKINSMGEQLDAIVTATEEASNTIMNAMERSDNAVAKLRHVITDPAQLALLDEITGSSNDVFEACAFQDITGQRINKVVKSITFVEQRISALAEIWGKGELEKVEVEPEKEKTENEKLLNGPQLAGQGLSQNDIDSLFD
ncbi:MAG: protein phosphatase CheZ [Proteobacteria bacterium]|nr:protein phosphatase CheZ [Pseudomonadota bacterium]